MGEAVGLLERVKDIVCSWAKVQEVHKRTASGRADVNTKERQVFYLCRIYVFYRVPKRK